MNAVNTQTMKIQYASDLHLEFADNRDYIEKGGILPVGDILILAGDISYLGDRKMIKRNFFDWCSAHYKETYIVPGNHEFYHGYDIAQTLENFEFSYRQNVRYLNNSSVVIGDTELFFTTLWTRIDPVYLYTIQRGMNDFRHGVLDGERFCANDVDGLHQRCLQWLQAALKASSARHKVIVTHQDEYTYPNFTLGFLLGPERLKGESAYSRWGHTEEFMRHQPRHEEQYDDVFAHAFDALTTLSDTIHLARATS